MVKFFIGDRSWPKDLEYSPKTSSLKYIYLVAYKALKDGKTPGIDQVYAEMLKADEQTTATVLTDILCDIWESEETPLSWKTGLIVKLPKRGDLTNCNNWRGIMLLSVTYKVLSRVVLNRLTTTVDPLLRKEQAGFRKGRSCADQIFTLRQIVEQSNEWSSTVYANFGHGYVLRQTGKRVNWVTGFQQPFFPVTCTISRFLRKWV